MMALSGKMRYREGNTRGGLFISCLFRSVVCLLFMGMDQVIGGIASPSVENCMCIQSLGRAGLSGPRAPRTTTSAPFLCRHSTTQFTLPDGRRGRALVVFSCRDCLPSACPSIGPDRRLSCGNVHEPADSGMHLPPPPSPTPDSIVTSAVR